MVTLERLAEQLMQIQAFLMELRRALEPPLPVKDFYNTAELAARVGRHPDTVRVWFRDQRILAEKAACGRGEDAEWRVSHAELVRYQNQGLRPESRRY